MGRWRCLFTRRQSCTVGQEGRDWSAFGAHGKDMGLLRCFIQGLSVRPASWSCALTSQQGKPFEFQRPYGSYIMENVLFKISYPAEFHAQTAVEAAHTIHTKLKEMGRTSDDIKSVVIRTQEAAIRIIDKQGPLDNFADRE